MPRTDFHEEKMHDFYYKNNELYCDKTRVAKILQFIGNPVRASVDWNTSFMNRAPTFERRQIC